MRSRQKLAGAVVIAVLAALTGCGGTDRPAEPGPSDAGVIRLGTLVPLSGRSSPSGQSMVNAAQLAVKEANDAGGVLGRRIELIVEDDACDPGTAVTAARTLVAKDITVSVGGYCSSATVPTLKIFRTAGIPMIVAQSNSTDLLRPGYDSVFLVCGTVTAEASFAVAWMARLGDRRLALVHDGTSFPITLAQETATAATRIGTVTVAAQLELSQGAPSYVRTANAVISSGADVVYYTGYYAEANQLIKDLYDRGYRGRIVVGDGATDGPLLENLTPAQTHEVYGTALLVPELMPELAEWSARYRAAASSSPGPSTVEAYDAVKLAIDAIRRAGTVDRAAVRAAISATNTQMLSGPMSFNADGSRTNPKFLLLHAAGRGFDLVPEPAAG